MLKKATGCVGGVLLGSLLKGFVSFVKFLTTLIAKILVLFGLWIPLLYAALGGVLYLACDFNPFDFSLYSTIYLSGAVACVICALIISVKNIIVKPAKSVYEGYKHPVWEKDREEKIHRESEGFYADETVMQKIRRERKEKKLSPKSIDEYNERKELRKMEKADREVAEAIPSESWLPKSDESGLSVVSVPEFERPKIYFSKLEPDFLIHEYSDRFELYRYENNRTTLDHVEYK